MSTYSVYTYTHILELSQKIYPFTFYLNLHVTFHLAQDQDHLANLLAWVHKPRGISQMIDCFL